MIKGTLFLWSETGTEGGHWALQDERFIEPPIEVWLHERWSYEGLVVLKDGDYLKILTPESTAYWEGYIQLKQYPVFTEDTHGFWIHADQSGIDRNFWTLPFFEGYRGELIQGLKEMSNV